MRSDDGGDDLGMFRGWLAFQGLYRRRTSQQYKNLNLNTFTDPLRPHQSYPKLKGRAAEIKHVVPALLRAWNHYMDPTNAEHKRVQAVLEAQFDIQSCIDEGAGDAFMTDEACAGLCQAVDRFLAQYSLLAHAADQAGFLIWNVAPKMYWLRHLAERSRYLHPRRSSCFTDEDYVGKVKLVCQACTSATALYAVPGALAVKYRRGMFARRNLQSSSAPL